MEVVAGTRNTAKLTELQRLVGDAARTVPPPPEAGEIEVDERGETFEENAAAKALAWSRHLHDTGVASLVIASDGGLLISALANWNPLRSRRFAGPDATDQERAERLIEMSGSLAGDERTIYWQEAVAIADQSEVVGIWCAESAPGMLATSVDRKLIDRRPGFWIPAIWLVPQCGNRLLATLSDAERDQLDDHWQRLRAPVRQALVTMGRETRSNPGQINKERSENRGSSSR